MRRWGLSFFAAISLFASPAFASPYNQLVGFGDSTLDSGWWRGALQGSCAGLGAPCTTLNPDKDLRIQNAIDRGGTGAPVGVGLMHSQYLAASLGVTANPVNAVGGGTNYAISGSLSSRVGGFGNLNPNAILPSTSEQIARYLSANPTANANALFVIGTGGNDLRYALDTWTQAGQGQERRNFIDGQISSLVAAVLALDQAGAEHILIDGVQSNGGLANYWNTQLRLRLDAAGVDYIFADVAGLLEEITANPTLYGFTSTTVLPGIAGDATRSACVSGAGASGWGQFCANRLTFTNGVPYARLRSADSEQTSLYSDNEHLSDAGQRLLAEYEYQLVMAGVPEVSTWAMILAGFAGLGCMAYRRSRKDQELALAA